MTAGRWILDLYSLLYCAPMERRSWDSSGNSGLIVNNCAGNGHGKGGSSRPHSRDERSKTQRRMSGNRVLILGRIRELALYRAEVLRDRGFEVKIPENAKEAIAEITRTGYDVAVLSYTLGSDEVKELAELVRQSCPECPLVTISRSGRLDRMVNPDETVLADDGPSALIEVLRRLQRNH